MRLRLQPRLLAAVLAFMFWLYGVVVVLYLIEPLYSLRGPVEARIALLWYHVWFLGNPVQVQVFEAARVYSVPVLAAALLALETGLAQAYIVLRNARPGTASIVAFTASLIALVAAGVLRALLRLLERGVDTLTGSYQLRTSAGLIVLGREVVETSRFMELGAWLALVLAGVLVVLSLLYILATGVLEESSASAGKTAADEAAAG